MSYRIGVFDSGVGGKYFVDGVSKRFPDAEVVYKEDKENLPYGDKSPQELLELTLPIFREFEDEGCDAVLVACNSVTTNIISELRAELSVPLVGVEPMIKPAAKKTQTGVIMVCATPATLNSQRYAELKRQFAENVEVIEPDCSNWAKMIEDNREDELELIKLVQEAALEDADIILLGCTHYHWIEDLLNELSGETIEVMQPTEPVLDQLERVLKEN